MALRAYREKLPEFLVDAIDQAMDNMTIQQMKDNYEPRAAIWRQLLSGGFSKITPQTFGVIKKRIRKRLVDPKQVNDRGLEILLADCSLGTEVCSMFSEYVLTRPNSFRQLEKFYGTGPLLLGMLVDRGGRYSTSREKVVVFARKITAACVEGTHDVVQGEKSGEALEFMDDLLGPLIRDMRLVREASPQTTEEQEGASAVADDFSSGDGGADDGAVAQNPEMARLRKEVQALKRELAEEKGKRKAVERRVQKVQDRADELTEQLQEAEAKAGRLDDMEAQLKNSKAQSAQLTKELKEKNALLATPRPRKKTAREAELEKMVEELEKANGRWKQRARLAEASPDERIAELEVQLAEETEKSTVLRKKCEELRQQQNRPRAFTNISLKSENEVLILPTDEDIFPGETKEHVLETLFAVQHDNAPRGRRNYLLRKVTDSCPVRGGLAQKREEIGRIFAGYRSLSGSMVESLRQMGFKVERSKHVKLTWGQTTASAPCTPGDLRSADNAIRDLRHQFF